MRELAQRRAAAASQVALAWVAQNPNVTLPVIGAGSAAHIDAAVSSIELTLDAEEKAYLREALSSAR